MKNLITILLVVGAVKLLFGGTHATEVVIDDDGTDSGSLPNPRVPGGAVQYASPGNGNIAPAQPLNFNP